MIPTVKTKSADGGQVRITKADLLNGAFTPVPSNTTATILSAKSVEDLADLKAGARHSATDMKSIQQIHDLTAGLGAVCGDGSSEEGKHVHAHDTKTTDDTDTKNVDPAADSPADAAAPQAAADAADADAEAAVTVKNAVIAALKAATQ
jgi:hypothetical protein